MRSYHFFFVVVNDLRRLTVGNGVTMCGVTAAAAAAVSDWLVSKLSPFLISLVGSSRLPPAGCLFIVVSYSYVLLPPIQVKV